MISTPRVCINIVASAFQYGWAPTLIPVTTMLTSPSGLRELDDAAQHERDPVHVLGAALHRDLRAGRHGEPLEGDVELARRGPSRR